MHFGGVGCFESLYVEILHGLIIDDSLSIDRASAGCPRKRISEQRELESSERKTHSRIVNPNDTPITLLHRNRSQPRCINEFVGILGQFGTIFSNEFSGLLRVLTVGRGRVDSEILDEKGRGREPHPVVVIVSD